MAMLGLCRSVLAGRWAECGVGTRRWGLVRGFRGFEFRGARLMSPPWAKRVRRRSSLAGWGPRCACVRILHDSVANSAVGRACRCRVPRWGPAAHELLPGVGGSLPGSPGTYRGLPHYLGMRCQPAVANELAADSSPRCGCVGPAILHTLITVCRPWRSGGLGKEGWGNL